MIIERAPNTAPTFGAVMSLLSDMHAENGVAPANWYKVGDYVQDAMKRGTVFLARHEGNAVGTLGMIREAYWYSDETAYFDKWFFVSPDARHTTAAARLVKAAKDYARVNRGKLYMGVWSHKDTARKNAFMARQLIQVGGLFASEI